MQNKVKAIIQELSLKYKKSPNTIKKIVVAPFKMNVDLVNNQDPMDENTPVVYHPNLGYFSFSEKKKNKKNEQINSTDN